MSVIATVDVAADDFTLGGALTTNPGIHITLERVIPLGSTFIPYFWVSDDSIDEVRAALESETDIEEFSVLDTIGDETLVRVKWREDVDGLLDAMTEADAVILEAEGEEGRWRFQLRFDDHESLTEFYRTCAGQGISLDLKSVHNPGLPVSDDFGIDLTDTQRETLLVALQKGYFDVPRRINLRDLSDELGVSDTAVSQRIRRGVTAVLVKTLADAESAAQR